MLDAPRALNVEVAELVDVPAVHEVRAAAGAEVPVLVDEAPAVAALGDGPARMEADERDVGGQQHAFAVGQLTRPRDALTLYFGGIANSMCTWSGMRCPSIISTPLCSQSLLRISPMSDLIWP